MSEYMSTVPVRVFHNVATDSEGRAMGFFGYEADHAVVEVFRTTASAHDDPLTVCSHIFELLNIGHDPQFGTPDPRAVAYRNCGHRSLSVGDCMAVGDQFYAVAAFGFTPIADPHIITR
jgi:hypothetical protein